VWAKIRCCVTRGPGKIVFSRGSTSPSWAGGVFPQHPFKHNWGNVLEGTVTKENWGFFGRPARGGNFLRGQGWGASVLGKIRQECSKIIEDCCVATHWPQVVYFVWGGTPQKAHRRGHKKGGGFLYWKKSRWPRGNKAGEIVGRLKLTGRGKTWRWGPLTRGREIGPKKSRRHKKKRCWPKTNEGLGEKKQQQLFLFGTRGGLCQHPSFSA